MCLSFFSERFFLLKCNSSLFDTLVLPLTPSPKSMLCWFSLQITSQPLWSFQTHGTVSYVPVCCKLSVLSSILCSRKGSAICFSLLGPPHIYHTISLSKLSGVIFFNSHWYKKLFVCFAVPSVIPCLLPEAPSHSFWVIKYWVWLLLKKWCCNKVPINSISI